MVFVVLSAGVLRAADELRFANGDRLTGEVIEQVNDQIRFRSPVFGVIVVPADQVTVAHLPDTPVESLAGLPPTQTAVVTSQAAPPSPLSTGTPRPTVVNAPAQAAAAKPDPSRWKGKLEFGFKQQSGSNETLEFSLRMEADRKLARNQYRTTGRMLYGEKNANRSADRYDATFRWRRDFNNHLFSQSLTTYFSDRIKSIDASYEQNVGVGYRVLNRDRHIINAGVGATAQYRQAAGADTNVQLLGEFFEDYTYRISGRFTLTQNTQLQWSDEKTGTALSGRQNYKVQFDTALQGKFTDQLSLNLRFEHEFDNAVVNRNARTDQRITSSLGYAF